MAETIGKYQVLERIGRGGMGTIYKAYDPILDRPVALKVISREIEVTDELRARFFREAQACARLSHPNVVTVYDMGEVDGRLYIVMEFLEGHELKHLIAHGPVMALENKLSIMMQVCDGLHYAHQKGIVHRDIKPGNIMLVRNGQVKILDFGIAHIADSEGLTRTGLIMGTLRYIAPEQVRGQGDHRSDIFSVGAVFYELLSLQPPFSGDNPIELLDKLRTEDPPPLDRVDPSIPPELAGIIRRGMQKDPGERHGDLGLMRSQLQRVQRELFEEAQQVRGRVHAQRAQLIELRTALAERIGLSPADAPGPQVDARHLATLRELERDLAGRIRTVQEQIARADSMAAALQRGTDLLAAGQFADAVAELEVIVAEMPEHGRALEALEQAREKVEAERRRLLADRLVRDARTAFGEGAYTLCLELLGQAAEIPPPAEAEREIAMLRESAEGALTAQQARQHAERRREQMLEARRSAEAQAASRCAPSLWQEAEVKASEAEGAFAAEAVAAATPAFELAASAYHRARDVAREARSREREQAERAREEAARQRERAHATGAPRYASQLWETAEARSAAAQAAWGRDAYEEAAPALAAAGAAYRRAEEEAQQARQRERRRAETAQELAAHAQRDAEAVDAAHLASAGWEAALADTRRGTAALDREEHAAAAEAFDRACALYQQAADHARESRRLRQQAEQGRQALVERRRDAVAADAAMRASAEWSQAEASAAAGEAALRCGAHAEAAAAFEEARGLYRQATGRASDARRALEKARADSEEAREATALARQAAGETRAPRYASELWRAGESIGTQASAALKRQEYAGARSLFAEARRQYMAAVQAARIAEEAEALGADAMLAEAARLLAAGDAAGCLRCLTEVLALRPDDPVAEQLRDEAEERRRLAEAARQEPASPAATIESVDTLEGTGVAGDGDPGWPWLRWARGIAIGASGLALIVWVGVSGLPPSSPPTSPRLDARATGNPDPVAGGVVETSPKPASVVREEVPAVVNPPAPPPSTAVSEPRAIDRRPLEPPASVLALPRPSPIALPKRDIEGAEPARGGSSKTRKDAEQARARAASARRAAEQVAAAYYAGKLFGSAQGKERDATTALERADYESAVRLLGEAESGYQAAAQESRRESETDGRQATVKASVEQARARTASRREQAVTAQADRLARSLFEMAEAKHGEADSLAKRQDLTAAAQAYQDAAQLYVDAALRAQAARDSSPSR
jgi:predicted Ser/Thr protein kinase